MVWPMHQPPDRNYIGNFPFNRQTPPDNMVNRIIPAQKVQSFLSPERIGTITNTLTKAQQVLKAVENAAPIIQQYGPMVKNLPAMFKVMKALKESDDAEIDDDEYEYESTDEDLQEKDAFYEQKEEIPGSSQPKLFIQYTITGRQFDFLAKKRKNRVTINKFQMMEVRINGFSNSVCNFCRWVFLVHG